MPEPRDPPRFSTSSRRGRLGFADSVVRHFLFLEKLGFSRVVTGPTLVRFERRPLFFTVFHGRGSYELGAELGRFELVDDVEVERAVPIVYLATVLGGEALDTYKVRSATTPDQVERFVKEMSAWIQSHAHAFFDGDDRLFGLLDDAVEQETARIMDEMRARELRERAQIAWRAGEFSEVVRCYDEIEVELSTEHLARFEKARRDYAQANT